jgi:hypothetical protein
VTMKALQSFETSEATLKKIKRVTFQKTWNFSNFAARTAALAFNFIFNTN